MSDASWMRASARQNDPKSIKAHRTMLENLCWPGKANAAHRKALHEACREFDRYTADQRDAASKRRSGRGGRKNLNVGNTVK